MSDREYAYMDAIGRRMFAKALAEDRCGELLGHLFEGDGVTLDAASGDFVYVSSEQLRGMTGDG